MSLNERSQQDDSQYNTRQRLESCTHGIQQLEALRLKHKLLMEQLRHDYPSMRSLIKSLGGEESDPISQQNSPSSACDSLAPSHVSDDSGCYDAHQNNSGGSNGLSDQTMDYSTFRKLSLEENPARKSVRPNSSHIVEATLKNLTSQHLPSTSDYSSYNSSTWSRLHKRRNPLNLNSTRPKSCYGSTNQQESESTRPTSMILCSSKNRDSKILDSNIFAQITPPLLQRKFVTSSQKLEEPAKIRVKQMPRRETPILKPKLTAIRPLKIQKAELRTLIIPPTPVSSTTTTSSPKFMRPKLSQKTQLPSWPQSPQAKRYQASQDYTVHCSNDIPRFAINTKVPSPSMSRVADAVRSFNSSSMSPQQTNISEGPTYDKWKKNIASVAPMPKHNNSYSTILDGSTTFPSVRKSQMPLVGFSTHTSKPQTMIQPQIFTSSCLIALGTTFKKPTEKSFIQNRRSREWHASEKL